MSERIADQQVVCPFIALDDDRDHRASVPDHRHRCFAERPPAPRALAHQAAYCLSAGFVGCPTFADWARREAAPVLAESPVRSPRDPASSPRPGAGAKPIDRVSGTPSTAADGAEPVVAGTGTTGRRGGAGWASPPPWAGGATGDAAPPLGAAAAAPASGGEPAEEGVAADQVQAPSPAEPASAAGPAADMPDDFESEAPAFLAGRDRPGPAAGAAPEARYAPSSEERYAAASDRHAASTDSDRSAAAASDRYAAAAADRYPEWDEQAPGQDRRPAAEPRRTPIGYAPVAPQRGERRRVAPSREHRDPDAPTWEEPRRFEEYPSLRSRGRGGIPRPALYAGIIVLIGAALFATPFLLRGLGGGGGGAQPTPTPSDAASPVPSEAASPTPVPTPAQVVHVVKSGDTLGAIAAKYGVTVDQILAANPSIKNPNKIAIGDEIVIPQAPPTQIVELTPAPSPSP